MKILLLSDTHGYIDQKILKYCAEADEVWHAGDIGDLRVMEAIGKVSAVRGVYGNIDGSEIRMQYPLDNRRSLAVRTTLETQPGSKRASLEKIELLPRVASVMVDLVFEPQWDRSMMSDEARLKTGMM